MKTQKIIYWITTGLLCLVMLYSASMYITQTEMVKDMFKSFGYPTYIVIPLAIAKILGLIAILWNKVKWLKEWAYAGFFFDFVLAFFAHKMINDGEEIASMVALIVLLISYFLGKKVRP